MLKLNNDKTKVDNTSTKYISRRTSRREIQGGRGHDRYYGVRGRGQNTVIYANKYRPIPITTTNDNYEPTKSHSEEKGDNDTQSEDEYNYENYDDDDDGDYEVNPDEVEKEYLKHFDKGMGNKEILSAKTPQESIAGMETNMMAAFLKIRESRRSSWGFQSE